MSALAAPPLQRTWPPAGLFISFRSPGRRGGLCGGAMLDRGSKCIHPHGTHGAAEVQPSSLPWPESRERDLSKQNCSEVHSAGDIKHALGKSKSGVSILHFTHRGSILAAFPPLCCTFGLSSSTDSPAPRRRPRAHTPARGLKMLHEIPTLPRTSGKN